MVCVPCIFVGIAIVVWCKYLEPYVKPVYERLCQLYPPLKVIGEQIGVWAGKIEKFGEKIGIRMPESCPMPKKSKASAKNSATSNEKLYPDLTEQTSDETDLHQRAAKASMAASANE